MEFNESAEKSFLRNEESGEDELTFEETSSSETETSLLRVPISINDSMTSEEIIQSSSWKKGQLAWARMSIYPFWPCMITYDPNSLMTFQKVQTIGKARNLMIHVHFFNDNGRHCWIPSHHMFPFHGIEDFRKRAKLVTDTMRKKEPKLAAALTIKSNIFGTWQKAVAEAMDVLYELDLSALDNFKPQLKDNTNKNIKGNSDTKKRKRKEDTNKTTKKFTKDADKTDLRVSQETSDSEVEKLNLETPPVSPPNEEDQGAAVLQKQKRIIKLINKLQPPDFEVYFERNFLTIKDQHSDTTDEQIREYLYSVWETMATEEKMKYRATYRTENC